MQPNISSGSNISSTSNIAKAIHNTIGDPFDLCDVPAGVFIYGSWWDTFTARRRRITLPRFCIAKYPITYRQFQIFTDAQDGYSDARWWAGLAVGGRHRTEYSEQTWKIATHPREQVSWFDAMAFCRWLSFKLGGGYAINEIAQWMVRLPTDFEWEKAARGTDGRTYPYGRRFDPHKTNTREAGPITTTPVMQYPQGESPYGVVDMSGNVWEWTLSDYQMPCIHAVQEDLRSQRTRVLRGGSWISTYDLARVSYRLRYSPLERQSFIGFRICCPVG